MGLSSAVGGARWYQGKGIRRRRTCGSRPRCGRPGRATTRSPCSPWTRATAGRPPMSPRCTRAPARSPTTRRAARSCGGRSRGRPPPAGRWRATAAGCSRAPARRRRRRRSTFGAAAVRAIGADQTNTTVVLGELAVLKCYRRLGDGAARELTRVRDLTAAGFAGVPAMHGAAELELTRDGTRHALLLLQAYIPRHLGRLRAGRPRPARADRRRRAPSRRRRAGRRRPAASSPGCTTRSARHGRRPRPTSTAGAPTARGLVAATVARVEPGERALLRAADDALASAWDAAGRGPLPAVGPAHGDLHLAQVLFGPAGPVAVIDFERAPSVLSGGSGYGRDPGARPRRAAALDRQRRAVDRGGRGQRSPPAPARPGSPRRARSSTARTAPSWSGSAPRRRRATRSCARSSSSRRSTSASTPSRSRRSGPAWRGARWRRCSASGSRRSAAVRTAAVTGWSRRRRRRGRARGPPRSGSAGRRRAPRAACCRRGARPRTSRPGRPRRRSRGCR